MWLSIDHYDVCFNGMLIVNNEIIARHSCGGPWKRHTPPPNLVITFKYLALWFSFHVFHEKERWHIIFQLKTLTCIFSLSAKLLPLASFLCH